MQNTRIKPELRARATRRLRRLASIAKACLFFRVGARSLSPAAWLFLFGGAFIASDAAELGWFAIPSLILFGSLCVIALIDARYFLIPDGPLLLLFATGLTTFLILRPEETLWRLAAAVVAYSLLHAVAWAFEKWRGIQGLGLGDARLFAVGGLWLGFAGLPSCLLGATMSAALAAVIAMRDGSLDGPRAPLPFGPHLALGIWLVWVLGPFLIN